MIKAVMDTNVLVSSLLSPSGAPAKVFNHVLNGNVVMCFDSQILNEYRDVLLRPKFKFNPRWVNQVLDFILKTGISIVPEPISIHFNDENDKVFYEVAISVRGHVVTGNKKHYPNEPIVVSPHEFLDIIEKMQL